MLGHLEGEAQVGELGRRRRSLGDDLQLERIDRAVVARLREKPARQHLDGEAGRVRVRQSARDQQAQVLFRRHDGDRFLARRRRNDDLGEDLGDLGRGCGVEGAVQRDDAAEGAERVAAERLVPGFDKRGGGRHSARVGVLDDGDGGTCCRRELGDELECCVGIVEVVVRQLLALELPGGGDTGPALGGRVQGSPLVGVLAVAQLLLEAATEGAIGRHVVAFRRRHPGRYRGVVGGGAAIGLAGEPLPEGERSRPAVCLHFGEHRPVVRSLDYDRDAGVVFRRRADHCRPADVDVLDAVFVGAPFRHGRLEGVEIADEEIDRRDAVLVRGSVVLGVAADGEQAAVDLWVQRLEAPVHHLGKAGQLGDVAHLQARLAQRVRRAAGRYELYARGRERGREFGEPRLVRDGQEGAPDRQQGVRHGIPHQVSVDAPRR